MNLFRKLKSKKEQVNLNKGDIFTKLSNGKAVKNGFTQYAVPEYFYEVLDINDNGVMVKPYLAKKYDNLKAGHSFNDEYKSHEDMLDWFERCFYIRPTEKFTKMFNDIVSKG